MWEEIWHWITVNYGLIVIVLIIVFLVLLNKGKFKRKHKKEEEYDEDVAPTPPPGFEFLNVELKDMGLVAQEKRTRQEIKDLDRRYSNLRNEGKKAKAEYEQKTKMAESDYNQKTLYFNKMGRDIYNKQVLLVEQLNLIEKMIKNEEARKEKEV